MIPSPGWDQWRSATGTVGWSLGGASVRTLRTMKTTHPAFWVAGWAGIAAGGTLVLFGLTTRSDVASFAGGYGLMVMGAALFALAGFKMRERLVERAESIRVRRIAIARLPQRPPSPTFGEQTPSSAAATVRADTPS